MNRPSQTDDTAKNSHDSAPAPGDVIYFQAAGPEVSPQPVRVVKIDSTAYVDARENAIYTIWWTAVKGADGKLLRSLSKSSGHLSSTDFYLTEDELSAITETPKRGDNRTPTPTENEALGPDIYPTGTRVRVHFSRAGGTAKPGWYDGTVTAYDPNDSTYEITYDDEDTESSVHEARIVQGVKDFSEQTTGPPADTIEANTNEPATTIAAAPAANAEDDDPEEEGEGDQERQALTPCADCGVLVGSVHKCPGCNESMHAFCGIGIGDEGFKTLGIASLDETMQPGP